MSGRAGKPNNQSKHRWKVVFWPRKLQNPLIETIIVDTTALIDSNKPVLHAYPLAETSSHDLMNAAAHALVGTTSVTLQQFRAVLPQVHTNPIAIATRPTAGTTWHNGKFYTTYWIGTVESLLQRCDLTENEREQTLAQVRRLNTQHKLVYCVASEHDESPVGKGRELILLGLIANEITIHRDLIQAIAFCREKNIRLIYASSDTDTTVSAVAHATKLMAHSTVPSRFDLKYHRSIHSDSYAHLSKSAHRTLIEQFDPSTTLVTNQPLTEVVKTIVIR